MVKSNKERQQEYRDRQRMLNVDRNINSWISHEAFCALERLADHFKTTKRDVIEQLVIMLDTDISAISKLAPCDWD